MGWLFCCRNQKFKADRGAHQLDVREVVPDSTHTGGTEDRRVRYLSEHQS